MFFLPRGEPKKLSAHRLFNVVDVLLFLSFGKLFMKLSCLKGLRSLLQTFNARVQNIDLCVICI